MMLPSFLTPGLATINWFGMNHTCYQLRTGQRRVLAFESDAVLREAIANALSVVVPVTEVESGRDLLRQIQVGDTSAIVMNLQPDDMNGEELLRLTRRQLPAAKVIVTSNSGSHDLVHRVIDQGICDFLEKPFAIDDLYRAVEMAMRGNAVRLDPLGLSTRQHERSRIRRIAFLAHA
jgi:DNA-binding NtrC family response regulator